MDKERRQIKKFNRFVNEKLEDSDRNSMADINISNNSEKSFNLDANNAEQEDTSAVVEPQDDG